MSNGQNGCVETLEKGILISLSAIGIVLALQDHSQPQSYNNQNGGLYVSDTGDEISNVTGTYLDDFHASINDAKAAIDQRTQAMLAGADFTIDPNASKATPEHYPVSTVGLDNPIPREINPPTEIFRLNADNLKQGSEPYTLELPHNTAAAVQIITFFNNSRLPATSWYMLGLNTDEAKTMTFDPGLYKTNNPKAKGYSGYITPNEYTNGDIAARYIEIIKKVELPAWYDDKINLSRCEEEIINNLVNQGSDVVWATMWRWNHDYGCPPEDKIPEMYKHFFYHDSSPLYIP